MYKVYMHKNKINNKVYIGLTSENNIYKRWGLNGKRYLKVKSKFSDAIKKYRWDGFEHIILFTKLTREEAVQKEMNLIKEYNSFRYGYNSDLGGTAKVHTVETKRKIGLTAVVSKAAIVNSHTPEVIAKQIQNRYEKGYVGRKCELDIKCCPHCEQSFLVRIKSKQKFCSKGCSNANRIITKETKIKISKSLKEYFAG